MHRTVAEKILDITEICRTHRVKTLELFGLAAGRACTSRSSEEGEGLAGAATGKVDPVDRGMTHSAPYDNPVPFLAI